MLIPLGLLIIAGSSIISHYFPLNDFINGSCKGIGIGIMLFALIDRKRTASA